MSKIEVKTVAEVLKRNAADEQLMRAVMEDIAALTAQEEGEEKPPALKKQFCILVSDPEGVLPAVDLVGWVLQIPESDSPATVRDRILRSAYEFNQTKRGRLLPVDTIGEAELWVKTKTPVLVLRTDNRIPQEAPLAEVES